MTPATLRSSGPEKINFCEAMGSSLQNRPASLESEADLSFEALAARQGVKPIAVFEDLLGSPVTEDVRGLRAYAQSLAKRRRGQFRARMRAAAVDTTGLSQNK
jgi:hypothetical protein